MSEEKSKSVQAIELARAVFQSISGGFGLIRFTVIEMKPLNGTNGTDSMKWKLICRFYESPSSSEPSEYEATVNLNDNTVEIKKMSDQRATVTRYSVTPQ